MAQLIGTAAQATFVQNVANKVAEWGYDGVDFDFEFPGNNCTPAQFSDFLNQLRTAVKAKDPNNIVMFGVSPGWWLESYEWSTLSSKADYAFYFCYDWNNPERGPMTKPGSSFTMQGGADIEASCRGALNYILSQGYPASQLVVGLPFAANGGAPYSGASAAVKSGTPDAASMEVSDGGGGWWPNAASMTMKVNAVLDPSASVLSGAATVAGVGFWQWGEENANSGADLSTAIRSRVDQLK
jgi:GH18 family chitinase